MKKKNESQSEMTPEIIVENKIFLIRGQKVMLDADLAILYGIKTKRFNEQVKRNLKKFPDDFMFQLTVDESKKLNWSQNATSSQKHRRRHYLPYAFTEHGVSMLSAILNSERAIQMSIFIIRAFIKMRELLSLNKELAQKIEEIEKRQKEYGDQLSTVYSVVKQLIRTPEKRKNKIGFRIEQKS